MEGLESGQWSRDILVPKEGRFVFQDKNARLKIGDKIYFWTYVDYFNGINKLGYRQDNGQWTVEEFVYPNGTRVSQFDVMVENKNGRPTQNPNSGGSIIVISTTTPNSVDNNNCRVRSATVLNGAHACPGQLIFNEDFNDRTISRERWIREHKFTGPPDYEFVVYVNDDSNSYIENGKFIVKPSLLEDKYGEGAVNYDLDLGNDCTGRKGTKECRSTAFRAKIQNPVLSARLRSKVTFRYGKITIRAKLPRGDWQFPELFLEPEDVQYDDRPDRQLFPGQLHIARTKGRNDVLSAGLMRFSIDPYRSYDMINATLRRNALDDFHDYTMEWTPAKIILSVDGIEYGTVHPRRLMDESEKLAFGTDFSKEVNLIVGLGAGGINDFPDGTPSKPWVNRDPKNVLEFWQNRDFWLPSWQNHQGQLQVDYIRIYAL
ncbi:beta-1,3-glucan-binding protein [Ctenocephalides felis]|uniref:beta-1,3-glucan-binding protein n=1 Tax=Ctenocephalides felis TaxID=7515 RepID=UPI000E6E1542|nr:beta-1,3-glucan-binding protein [Ctenocephalides felis]